MSFGSTRGAIVSLKNNRRSRKSKLDNFQKNTGSISSGIKEKARLSEADLEKLRKDIIASNRQQNIKVLSITAVIMACLAAVFFLYMF